MKGGNGEKIKESNDEKKLRETFNNLLITLSLSINDSIKWKKESERLEKCIEIRNKELEYYIKTKVDYEHIFKDVNEFLMITFKLVAPILDADRKEELRRFIDITSRLKPYICLDDKKEQEKKYKLKFNCDECPEERI